MKIGKTLLIISGLTIGMGAAVAQLPKDKAALETKHNTLLNEIKETQKVLNETKEEKNVSMSQLKALQSQMHTRQNLIANLTGEISAINKDIADKTKEINELTAQIEKLRLLYTQSVRYSYKHQSAHNVLAFVLAADNFNDGMRRYQYMKKTRDLRKHQADQLKTGQKKISNSISSLNQQKTKNVQLKSTQEDQKNLIAEETVVTQTMVDELRAKEGDLTASIDKKRSDARKLDATIKNIIKEEIRLTQLKAKEEEQKRQRELAFKEQERQRKLQEQQEADELKRKLENDKRRIEQEKEERALLAKKEAEEKEQKKATPAATSSEPVRNETDRSALASMEKVKVPPAENKSRNTQPQKDMVVAAASRPDEPPKVNKQVAAPNVDNTAPANYKNALSEDLQNTSKKFVNSRGALPWPVNGGYISAPFGKYPHPLEPKVTLENLGVDIATKQGTAVKAVFNGTVTTVVSIAGTYTVIVNHGEYFTVYSNLSSTSVSKGQNVSSNQQVGVVGLNDEGEYIVHFEICRVGTNNAISNENPTTWISR